MHQLDPETRALQTTAAKGTGHDQPTHWLFQTFTYRDGLTQRHTSPSRYLTADEAQQIRMQRLRAARRPFEHGPGWVEYREEPPQHVEPCTIRLAWVDALPGVTYWQPGDLARNVRPRPGYVVLVECDDASGERGVRNFVVRKVDRLGCGCWRLRGDRPGTIASSGTTLPTMEALTGCGRHACDILAARGAKLKPVLRQDAMNVVSADPAMAAAVDAAWRDDPAETVVQRMARMQELCVSVLRRFGYEVRASSTADETTAIGARVDQPDPWGGLLDLIEAGEDLAPAR